MKTFFGKVLVIDVTKTGIEANTRLALKVNDPQGTTLPQIGSALSLERASLFEYSTIASAIEPFRSGSVDIGGSAVPVSLVEQVGLAKALKQPRRTRLLGPGPASMTVFLLSNAENPVLPTVDEVKETKRNLVIVDNLRTLASATKPTAAPSPNRPDPTVRVTECTIELAYLRASVKVTASSSSGKGAASEKTLQSIELTTGPKEHLGLSVDLGVNRIDEVKYDAEKDQLVEKEAPGEFLVSVNWWLGDIATSATELDSWSERIGFKLLLRGSKKPLDTVGVGVTMRFQKLEFFGEGLGGFQPFAAAVWRQEDEGVDSDGEINRGYGNAEAIVGISFDISRVKDWWKK